MYFMELPLNVSGFHLMFSELFFSELRLTFSELHEMV